MLVNNTPCGTPQQNLDYQSKSCFYGQGFDAKNASNVGVGGVGLFHGKFNDILGFRNLSSDPSIVVSEDLPNRLVKLQVAISAVAGNTIVLQPDGIYSAGGGAGTFSYGTILVNVTPYTIIPVTGWNIYLVDATIGNITINFPTAVGSNAVYTIKKTDATANTVILTPNGAETIDGSATKTIRFQNTSVDIYSDNTNLYIM